MFLTDWMGLAEVGEAPSPGSEATKEVSKAFDTIDGIPESTVGNSIDS